MEAVNGGSLGEDKGGPPPPSPLTGCYLLVVIGEPHSAEHKDIILQRVAKGLLSWDVNNCLVDLEKELSIITDQGLEGEEARYGERLIQFASENLVTEILIHPAVSTLSQCVRNLLSSFTRHRHIIHAGYTFQGNGSWALQDGTFSYSDFSEAFQEIEVQRVIHAYENGISVDLHCSPEGDWTRLPREAFSKACKVRLNSTDVLTTGSPSISNFIKYLTPFLVPTSLENILESSDVVGNIRFSRPTLYVFPGGQGDAALFGINGFNMLLDGGYSRKACFWDFVRHLDRLDAVLMTRLNNSSICGISSVLKRKRQGAVYPQIGHVFCNIQERKSLLSPDGDKDRDPLIFSILEEGQSIVQDLQHLNLVPQSCYKDPEPIILYHKVGHGTLNMYVLSPDRNSREVREFLQKWNQSDPKMFAGTRGGRDFSFPLQNLVSICALLVWQPANPNDTITRILYPGSTPQKKIFDGLDKLKSLDYIKHPVCSEKSLAPVKKSKQEVIDKLVSRDKVITEKKTENKLIEDAMKNGEMNGDVVREKLVKKSDSLESDKEKKIKKGEDSKKTEKIEDVEKIVENGEKVKTKARSADVKLAKKREDSSQHRKKPAPERKGPPTPKKTLENRANGEVKEKDKEKKAPQKPSPSATPAKSTKDANNRRVIESKRAPPKKEVAASKPVPPTEAKSKPERKPISRRPKTAKGPPSPMKKMANGVQKPDSISKRGKLDKEGTTDSSTVSTPSADQESVLKKDITKLTPEEIQQLKDKELDELKEEQEAVKEIEAVFRKGEDHVQEAEPGVRKIKEISLDDNLEAEEYLIIEKEEIEHDSLDQETKEDEMQKLARDSEESEKQRKHSSEEKEIDIKKDEIKEVPIPAKEELSVKIVEESKKPQVSSPEDKVTPTTDKKELADEEVKEVVESQPEEKVSANVESGATTTAPTLPEDERITLDDIKEDNGQHIEEKHVKEETKEKEVPIIQLPPQSQQDSQPKIPLNVGISLDKQKHIRDIVKTPDEVADLPVHEEADYHEFHGDGKKISDSDMAKDTAKEGKKIEEQKETKQIVDGSTKVEDGKEKDDKQKLEQVKVVDELQKEIAIDIATEEKHSTIDKVEGDLKQTIEIRDEVRDEKDEIQETLAIKEVSKDILKTESQAFLDQEKSTTDHAKKESVTAASTIPVLEKPAEIITDVSEEITTKTDEAQKFEVLEKADLETKEKVDKGLSEEKLKESIDDEWVVITKEDEGDQDVVETAQEADKAMEDTTDDLKEQDCKIIEDVTKEVKVDYKFEIKEEVVADGDEKLKTEDETLPDKGEQTDKKLPDKEVPIKEKEPKDLTGIPKIPKRDEGSPKEKEMESESEYDEHELRNEDEIEEILENDKEDIKALIEEADKKTLDDNNVDFQEEFGDTAKITTPEEEKISHIKETKKEVEVIDNKIQELRKDIIESVDELDLYHAKKDLSKIEESLDIDLKHDVEKLVKIDDKLQELKHSAEEKITDEEEVKIEKSTKSPEHAEQVTLPDSSPEEDDQPAFGELDIDKTELGRKSPAEREEDVKKIVVSVAEVLKSEAPLEEFQGKLPFTQELRETHITTQDSPILEAKIIINDDIPPIPEEPTDRKDEPADVIERRKDLIAGAQELIAASSKVISDIKSKVEEKVDQIEEQIYSAEKKEDKLEENAEKSDDKEQAEDTDEKDDDSGTVHRMLVTASSEDGGEEIEICPPGTITFSKSSESSGRSSPEPFQKTQSQKSSIVETLSDPLSTVKQITEKDLGIEKTEIDEIHDSKRSIENQRALDSIKDKIDSAKETAKAKSEIPETEGFVSDVATEKLTKDVTAQVKVEEKKTDKIDVKHDKIKEVDVKNIETEIKEVAKLTEKATKTLGVDASKDPEDSKKSEDVSDKIGAEQEDVKVTEETGLKKDICDDLTRTVTDVVVGDLQSITDNRTLDAKTVVTSKLEDKKIPEESTDLKKDTSDDLNKVISYSSVVGVGEIKNKIDGEIFNAKEVVTSKVEDAVEQSKDINELFEEEDTKVVDNFNAKHKIENVSDLEVDKSKEIVSDVSTETKESVENKTGEVTKASEEVKDLIKEEIHALNESMQKEIGDSKNQVTGKIEDLVDAEKPLSEELAQDLSKVIDLPKDKIENDKEAVKEHDSVKIKNIVDGKEQLDDKIKHDVSKTSHEIKDETSKLQGVAIELASGKTEELVSKQQDQLVEQLEHDSSRAADETKHKSEGAQGVDKGYVSEKIEYLESKAEKLDEKIGHDFSEIENNIKYKAEDLKVTAIPLTEDLKSNAEITGAEIKKLIQKSEGVIEKGSEDLKQLVEQTVSEAKDMGTIKAEEETLTVVGEVDKIAKIIQEKSEQSLDNAKKDISSKVEATVDESSKIVDKVGLEIVQTGNELGEKIQDSKEVVLETIGDLIVKTDKIKEAAESTAEEKVQEVERKLSVTIHVTDEEAQEVTKRARGGIQEDLKEVKEAVVEYKKDIVDEIGDISISVFDVVDKIEETIGKKVEDKVIEEKSTGIEKVHDMTPTHIDATANTKKSLTIKEGNERKDEPAIINTDTETKITNDKSLAALETKAASPESKESIIEKAEELLEQSEHAIGTAFSAIGDIAKSVFHEIIPNDKGSASETKNAKPTPDDVVKDEHLDQAEAISGKATPEFPTKEIAKLEDHSDKSDEKLQTDKAIEDNSSSFVDKVDTTKETTKSKPEDVKDKLKELETKIKVVDEVEIVEKSAIIKEVLPPKSETKIVDAVKVSNESYKPSEEIKNKGVNGKSSTVEKVPDLDQEADGVVEKTKDAIKSTAEDDKEELKESDSKVKILDEVKYKIVEKSAITEQIQNQPPESGTNIADAVKVTNESFKTSAEVIDEIEDKLIDGKSVTEEKVHDLDHKADNVVDSLKAEAERVVEKAEKLLDMSEKAIESAFSAKDDAAKSAFYEILPDQKSSAIEMKSDQVYPAEDKDSDTKTPSNLDMTADTTVLSQKSTSDILDKDSHLEHLSTISDKSTSIEPADKASEEAEKSEDTSKKSAGFLDKALSEESTKTKTEEGSVHMLEQTQGTLIETEEGIFEKSEKAVESVLSAIGGAVKSFLHDVSSEDNNKRTEELQKSQDGEEKGDEKEKMVRKEELQKEEKETEDCVVSDTDKADAVSSLTKIEFFESSLSIENKIDKELTEKFETKIHGKTEHQIEKESEEKPTAKKPGKAESSDEIKVEKEIIENEEKQIDERISHLQRTLDEVTNLEKIVSFEKCHIPVEEVKPEDRQLDTLEKTLEKVSDITNKQLDIDKTEKSELSSEIKIEKEITGKEEKQIEERVSHLQQTMDEVTHLEKSISFEKCHISKKEDQLLDKEIKTLETGPINFDKTVKPEPSGDIKIEKDLVEKEDKQIEERVSHLRQTLGEVTDLEKSILFEKCHIFKEDQSLHKEIDTLEIPEKISDITSKQEGIDQTDKPDPSGDIKIDKDVIKKEEKQIQEPVSHIEQTLGEVTDLEKSISFEKCHISKEEDQLVDKEIKTLETGSVNFDKTVKPEPSSDIKIEKEVIKKEEKQIEERVSHLEQTLGEVTDLEKSISFEKCHISEKEDQSLHKQIVTLEKTLEEVSDITKSIVLEKNEKALDESKSVNKEVASTSDTVIDSNKLGDMHHKEPKDDECKEEKLTPDQQEKKDPEKEHVKLEDKGAEKSEVNKQVKEQLEQVKNNLECDVTKSVDVGKSEYSLESHKLDNKISETSKTEESEKNLKKEDSSLKTKDSIVVGDQHISSQTEKCEKESMEKTSSEKDFSSLKVEFTEPKKLSISDVEICIKTEECPQNASQSFLDNERALLRDNIDAKVYVHPICSQDDGEVSKSQASSSSILQVTTEAPAFSDKSSPDLELSGKTTPPTVPVSPIPKDLKSPSSKLDSGLSEQTETDDEDLSTKSQVAHSQSDLDELDIKMDPMSTSFYGALPEEQADIGGEVPATLLFEITKAKYAIELKQEDEVSETKAGEVDLMTASCIGELPSLELKPSDSKEKGDSGKDAIDTWGKPLGLPAPTNLYELTKAKFSSGSEETDLMTCSFIGDTLPTSSSTDRTQGRIVPPTDPMTTSVYFEHSADSGYDPIASWGKPLGLPSPAPPNNNDKGTPKKERKLPAYVTAKNKLNDDKKRADSPSKLRAKKISPVYVDLTYVPHHGNHYYSYVDFFKKIRARYYVFSGLEPSRQVYEALLEAKQTWEDKELEVTIIPTYDTDILGYWVAENEELLSKFKIDLSPSASRCTINLQDHETSCSAYRLEF